MSIQLFLISGQLGSFKRAWEKAATALPPATVADQGRKERERPIHEKFIRPVGDGGCGRVGWAKGFNLPGWESGRIPCASTAVIKGTRPAEIGLDPAAARHHPRLPALISSLFQNQLSPENSREALTPASRSWSEEHIWKSLPHEAKGPLHLWQCDFE